MPTIAVSGSNFVVLQSSRMGEYTPHVFKNKAQFTAWMAATHCHDIFPAGQVRGKAKPAVDHRHEFYCDVEQEEVDYKKEIEKMDAQARQQTTTPVQKTQAQVDIAEIQKDIHTMKLNHEVNFQALHNEVLQLRAVIERLLQSPPAAQPTTGQDAHANGYVVFMAETLVMSYDDAGKPVYKAKGGRYAKFGVRVWPEVVPLLGIDAAALKPGPNAFGKMVKAELGEVTDKETGEKSMVAKKIIGLAE
jgi:hypothetical protein